MERNRFDSVFAKISWAAAAIMIGLVLFMGICAVKPLKEDYRQMKTADLSERFTGTIAYDDHLYAVLGFGIDLTPDMADREGLLADFLDSSLERIDERILSAGLAYAIAGGTALAYGLYHRFGNKTKKHVSAICLSVMVIYLLYASALIICHRINGIPFLFPKADSGVLLITGLISVSGGLAALGLLLRRFCFKKTAAILAVPLILLLFLFGFVREHGLYNEAQLESFAYLAEIDSSVFEEDYAGDIRYDEEKGLMIWNGKEYPPEMAENPEHYTGIGRIIAVLLEAADPFSGSALAMLEGTQEAKIPFIAGLLYVLKGSLWIFLPDRLDRQEYENENG